MGKGDRVQEEERGKPRQKGKKTIINKERRGPKTKKGEKRAKQ